MQLDKKSFNYHLTSQIIFESMIIVQVGAFSSTEIFVLFKTFLPGVPGILTFIDKNIEPLIF